MKVCKNVNYDPLEFASCSPYLLLYYIFPLKLSIELVWFSSEDHALDGTVKIHRNICISYISLFAHAIHHCHQLCSFINITWANLIGITVRDAIFAPFDHFSTMYS